VVLWANYFEMKFKEKEFFRYVVTVKRVLSEEKAAEIKRRMARRDGDPTKVVGRTLREVIRTALAQLSPRPIATEYKSQVISLSPLELPESGVVRVQTSHPNGPWTCDVNFGTPAPISIQSLESFLENMVDPSDITDQVFPKFADNVDALNVIVGHAPRSVPDRTAVVGRGRFFSIDENTAMRQVGYERMRAIIRGYFQSVRPATGRILLNVNVTHGVFHRPENLGQLLTRVGLNLMHRLQTLSRDQTDEMRKRLSIISNMLAKVRARVETGTNDDGSPRFSEKTILGLARLSKTLPAEMVSLKFPKWEFASPSQLQFRYDPGPNSSVPPAQWHGNPVNIGDFVSVLDFHRRRWGRTAGTDLPLVRVGKVEFMPAEWVTIIPGQIAREKLKGDDVQEMLDLACRSPALNAQSIVTAGRNAL